VTASEKKRDLALYRLKEAEESLDEAEFLFEGFSGFPLGFQRRAMSSILTFLRPPWHAEAMRRRRLTSDL
jgi:hypothetical protein